MPHSLSNVIVHIVFGTKGRAPLIRPDVLERLHAYLVGTCNAVGSHAIRVGGTSNHVHIACALSRTLPVSKLLEKLKTSSSIWMKSADIGCADFAWQAGYGVFSVDALRIDSLVRYIDNQNTHHRALSFEAEYIELLHRHHVAYDERYLWE